MAEHTFTTEEARRVGEQIGIDWGSAPFDVEQFRVGMDVELEHGTRDGATDVTGDDAVTTGKIALAHLNEFADYYTRLAQMEHAAEAGMPFQHVHPYLFYEDVAAALEWLGRAFGFQETLRFAGSDGRVTHAEMATELGGQILLGRPGGGYRGPRELGTRTALVHVYVEDVDAHHERAKAAGAEIREEPTDQPYGDRRYDAYDPEGQLWSFAQRVRDVPPEEWGATAVS